MVNCLRSGISRFPLGRKGGIQPVPLSTSQGRHVSSETEGEVPLVSAAQAHKTIDKLKVQVAVSRWHSSSVVGRPERKRTHLHTDIGNQKSNLQDSFSLDDFSQYRKSLGNGHRVD